MPSPNVKIRGESGPPHAPAILTINLSAIRANYRLLAERARPAKCAAVVKADAYGLGIGPVAKALVEEGCNTFFVAFLDEGIELRAKAPSSEIFVFSGPFPGEEDAYTANKLVPVLNSLSQARLWAATATKSGTVMAGLHIDTGMSRLGLPRDEIETLLQDSTLLKRIEFKAVMSHLACSDTPEHRKNAEQLRIFSDVTSKFPGIPASLAASSGIFLSPDFHFEMVRPGAGIFGVAPNKTERNVLQQVVNLQAQILQVRDVDSPDTVGYGAAHYVSGPMRIATIGVGYADGYMRSLGGMGMAWAGKTPLPVVGRISMDLITLDISQAPQLDAGDTVELIGPNRTVDMVAEEAGTIGYEILTSLGRRYRRRYVETAP